MSDVSQAFFSCLSKGIALENIGNQGYFLSGKGVSFLHGNIFTMYVDTLYLVLISVLLNVLYKKSEEKEKPRFIIGKGWDLPLNNSNK